MKRHVETLSDSFIDFEGKLHRFVIAAVSDEINFNSNKGIENNFKNSENTFEVDIYAENYGIEYMFSISNKALYLGISICHPNDDFDLVKGANSAVAKAVRNKPVILVTKPGIINTTMVQALLRQEAEYLKANPENYIKGYSDKLKRWKSKQAKTEFEKTLSNAELDLINKLKDNPNYLDNIYKYLNWNE